MEKMGPNGCPGKTGEGDTGHFYANNIEIWPIIWDPILVVGLTVTGLDKQYQKCRLKY